MSENDTESLVSSAPSNPSNLHRPSFSFFENCELDEEQSSLDGSPSITASPPTSSSLFRPILAAHARARTLVEGYHGSLFRNEELTYYFPEAKISIFVVTWNMGSASPPTDLNPFVLPESVIYVPDLLVVGVQEAPQGNYLKEWEIELQKTIGPTHVLLHSTTHGALHMALYLKKELTWCCSLPEEETINTRSPCAIPMLKTKGAIGVSLRFFGTSFLFINSHLPAHESQLKSRIEAYDVISTCLNLPHDASMLKTRYISRDITARFDCVFWFGDFNFRIEKPYEEVVDYLTKSLSLSLPSSNSPLTISPLLLYAKLPMEPLLKYDQLNRAMRLSTLFRGFHEAAQITFPPTYKFDVGTDDYDTSQLQRTPSFTDRIMYRCKRLGHVVNHQYNFVPDFQTSDHRPVFALFDAQLRAGRDKVPLNVGQFNREVYLEGLQRRANEAGLVSGSQQGNDCRIS